MVIDVLQATALGAVCSSVKVATGYPGGPVTGVLEYLAALHREDIRLEWSVDEKSAAAVAFGVALSGERSLLVVKHVGLNVASDTIMNASFSGVKGGFVVVVGADPGGRVSQNEMDDRYYAPLFRIPMLEPSSPKEAHEMTMFAFDISEKYGVPILLRISSTLLGFQQEIAYNQELEFNQECKTSQIKTAAREKTKVSRFFPSSEQKMLGIRIIESSRNRHLRLGLTEKDLGWKKFHKISFSYNEDSSYTVSQSNNETPFYTTASPRLGIVTSGGVSRLVYNAVKASGKSFGVLTIGVSYPLPEDIIKNFIDSVDTVLVVEEIEPYIEDFLGNFPVNVRGKITGDLPAEGALCERDISIAIERIQGKNLSLRLFNQRAKEHISTFKKIRFSRRCPIKSGHEALREAIKAMEDPICIGDVGIVSWAATEPFSHMISIGCMGTSIAIASGLYHAGDSHQEIIAIIGDSSFFHSGIQSLINAVYHAANITVIIFDNHQTGETGGQPNPGTGRNINGKPAKRISIEEIVGACGVSEFFLSDPFDIGSSKKAIIEASRKRDVSVVLLSSPEVRSCK